MKAKTILLLLMVCLVTSSHAQFSLTKGWKLKRIGVFFGEDQDRLNSMDYNFFLDALRGSPPSDFSNFDVSPTYTYSMICENPYLRLQANFQNKNYPQIEMGLGLVSIFDRIDEVVYATPNANYGDPNYQDLYFTQRGSEIAIEPTLSYRSQSRAFALAGSVGANIGYHFANSLSINGTNIYYNCDNSLQFRDISSGEVVEDNCYYDNSYGFYAMQRNGFSARLFADIQASFTIAKRLEMGTMLRRGIGVRQVNQTGAIGTNLHSFAFFTRWVLK